MFFSTFVPELQKLAEPQCFFLGGDVFVSSFHFVPNWLESRLWPGFFVNNQFRIIADQRAAGSDNLENIFQENLRRIGQVVAVLDTWQEPIYLQRVWTIYEQFVACSMNIPVFFSCLKRQPTRCLRDCLLEMMASVK